jgi:iron(III) transport system ATP-binding protein
VYVTHDQEEAMVLSDEIAVMHEGRLLQSAAPETIYARPATRTVAAFFGTPNLLPAKAREVRREGAEMLARVDGDGWEGWCAAPADLRPGDAVTVIVRPEIVRVGPEPRGAGIVWNGVVRQRIFRGSRNLYTVEAGSLHVTVDAPPDLSLVPGSEARLVVDAAHVWCVKE